MDYDAFMLIYHTILRLESPLSPRISDGFLQFAPTLFLFKALDTPPEMCYTSLCCGALAQLVAHNTGSVGVSGSNPLCSTSRNPWRCKGFGFFCAAVYPHRTHRRFLFHTSEKLISFLFLGTVILWHFSNIQSIPVGLKPTQTVIRRNKGKCIDNHLRQMRSDAAATLS